MRLHGIDIMPADGGYLLFLENDLVAVNFRV